MSIKEILLQVSIWIVLLPFFVGLSVFKKLNRDSVIVWGIVTLATIPQIFTAFVMNSEFLVITYNIYTPIEFFLTFLLFRDRLIISDRLLMRICVFLYCIGSAVILISSGLTVRFLNEWVCLNSIFYMLWILVFFKRQYSLKEVEIEKSSPFTWYLMGLSLYAPCTLMVFAFYHYIRAHPLSFLKNLWIIHNFFNIIMYIMFAAGFIVSFLQAKKSYLREA